MKKVTILGLVLLGLGFYSLVSADIPPGPGFHYVDSCLIINNMDQFVDVAMIGVYSRATSSGEEGFLIENGKCITSGYKFNNLNVYLISKNNLKSIDLKKLKTKTEIIEKDGYSIENVVPIDLTLLGESLPFYAGYVKNNTHIKKETLEYSLYKNINGSLFLYKSKKITEYNNGTANKIETFSSPENTQKIENKNKIDKQAIGENNNQDNNQNQEFPKPIKRSFWRSVLCFFGFNKSC